jgi:hypothetical protein
MSAKADFTAQEWSQLIESAMLASVALTATEPSGLWGTLQEGFANATGLVGARSSETPLIKEIVATLATSDGRTIATDAIKQRFKGVQAGDAIQSSITAIGAVSKILDAKAGPDAGPFKTWIYANAERVAQASSEGGFLGFGGQKVSENERATLAQLSTALGLPAR